MTSDAVPLAGPRLDEPEVRRDAALQRASWRSRSGLSSGLNRIERFLAQSAFDRAPWLAVCFGCGIAAWFALALDWQWLVLITCALLVAALCLHGLREDSALPFTRIGLAAAALALAAGTAMVWMKSAQVGTPGLTRPFVGILTGRVIAREDRPAAGDLRLIVATTVPGYPARSLRVRIRLPMTAAPAGLTAGALIRVKARLMPPAPPMLPGGHDFARTAWFQGIGATGLAIGPLELITPGESGGRLAAWRAALSAHIATRLSGSAGGIAAALASGDRGGIDPADEAALRDAGLSHLLSVSGLHVSAVVAATYLLVARLLALLPWLALRVRIPLWAAAGAALSGVFYTLLTGAEVPTVRSMIGALLVLAAVALGREALSLRLLAVAAFAVMLLWPEAVMGPSFQLSFAAVLAIVALHGAGWMRRFTAARDEPLWQTGLRQLAALLLTGVVIEIALMPIGLYHFHRAGVYGAMANVIAIPLTTFVIMPAVGLGLLLDLAGLGAPAWWCADQALALLLGLSHRVANVPGAVALFPAMGPVTYGLFLAGGLWLALWPGQAGFTDRASLQDRSRRPGGVPVRLWGLAPIGCGLMMLFLLRPADVLVSGDGRHVAITGLLPGQLAVLRDSRGTYARDMLNEMAGLDAKPVLLDQWPGARCNADFCALTVTRGGHPWHLLVSRGHDPVPLRDIVAACERADLVISDRWLPAACRPHWLKLDRHFLTRSGGVAIRLGATSDPAAPEIETVNRSRDDHGWRPVPVDEAPFYRQPPAPSQTATAPARNQ